MTFKNSIRAEGLLANIDEMVVHHANRGRGIGSQLLQAAIASATERGCARVELESAFRRVEAHAFYERRGFQNRAYYFSLPLV
jgi:GNAT superfamily N-acetyltransferase